MSLNWNAEAVKDREQLHADTVEWTVTESLIWSTMLVGLPTIKNDAEAVTFHLRLQLMATAMDRPEMAHLMVATDTKPTRWERRPITLDDIRRRIGLTTNATRYTAAQFLKELQHRIDNTHATLIRERADAEKETART